VKLATVEIGNGTRVAVVEEGRAVRLLPETAGTLLEIVERQAPLADLVKGATSVWGPVRFVAPIGRPRRNVFCVGKNYHEHAQEFAKSGFDSSAASGAIPDAPIVFSKVPDCVIGPDDAIEFDPSVSTAIDYEGELAVIVGTPGRKISKADALKHVWGYTIVNDVTARDVQGRLKQWLVGKSFDTYCPMGPWAVTADEIDLGNTTLKTWVNGELRQNANTRDLIFDVPTIIETISAGVTLRAGDIIATGTPVGVGIGFTPPKYLKNGDVVEIEIGGIGRLKNPVRTI
jgi:2-keto-4-pentenoate hydratase/2-oxohepta-3-ene-1,7-dioic acid hydratase in catechol pathway